MIYIILTAAVLLFAMVLTEPEVIEASAQTPKDSANKPSQAKSFSFSRGLIVKVYGDSAAHLNIKDGSKIRAKKVTDAERSNLSVNDIVVISSKSTNGDNPYRLRQIQKIEDGNVFFKNPPVSEFKELKSRNLSAVFAKVTHRAA